jgi:hypothetical protein
MPRGPNGMPILETTVHFPEGVVAKTQFRHWQHNNVVENPLVFTKVPGETSTQFAGVFVFCFLMERQSRIR